MSSKPPLFYFHFFLLAILEVWQVYIIRFHLRHQHFLCAILILILILIFFYVFFVEFSKVLKWLRSVGGNVSSGHLSHYSNKPVCYSFFFMVNYFVTIFLNYKSLATLYFFLIANVATQVDI